MKDWDKLKKVGEGAALTENKDQGQSGKTTKPKHLKSVPIIYFENHKKLKTEGGTSLNFTDYIIEALREKLERDKAL